MFSLTTEYAMKAVVYLTQNGDDGPVPSHRIAEDLAIPSKYLSTILRDLVRAGILVASPGKTGGFRISKEPGRLRLIDVVSPFEIPILGRRGCPFGNAECNNDDPCAGHDRWMRVKQEIERFLNETTVRDISVRPRRSNKKRRRR